MVLCVLAVLVGLIIRALAPAARSAGAEPYRGLERRRQRHDRGGCDHD